MTHSCPDGNRRAAWLLGVPALLAAACGSSSEARAARREIGEAADAAGEYTESTLSSARAGTEERLSALRADLARLRERIAEEAADEKWKDTADGIEAKLESAGKEIAELGRDGADAAEGAWERLRAGLESVGAELQETWREIRD